MIGINSVKAQSWTALMLLVGMLMFCPLLLADYTRALYAYNHYDYETARNEFTLVALSGHKDAQYYLGEIYEGAIGVPADYERAFDWYEQAAQQQHARAQFRLATLYLTGRGVEQDDTHAFSWYLRSAENGYPLAQYEVGGMYARGQGVPLNRIEAYKWLTIAASYGDPEAMAGRGQVSGVMSPADSAAAAQMARDWEHDREQKLRTSEFR